MGFYIGQKVICVCDEWCMGNNPWTGPAPKKGEKYTVREYLRDEEKGVLERHNQYIRVFEIQMPAGASGSEIGFFEQWFKPLDERKTDISVFTKILNGELRPLVKVGKVRHQVRGGKGGEKEDTRANAPGGAAVPVTR